MKCAMCRYDPGARVAESWSLREESFCPTQNTLRSNGKHDRVYKMWRGRWTKLFGDWLSSIPTAEKYRRLTITRHFGKGNRAFDSDNFSGGCKPLRDVVVTHGALYDDSPLWAEVHYQQLKSADGLSYVELLIEELT